MQEVNCEQEQSGVPTRSRTPLWRLRESRALGVRYWCKAMGRHRAKHRERWLNVCPPHLLPTPYKAQQPPFLLTLSLEKVSSRNSKDGNTRSRRWGESRGCLRTPCWKGEHCRKARIPSLLTPTGLLEHPQAFISPRQDAGGLRLGGIEGSREKTYRYQYFRILSTTTK